MTAARGNRVCAGFAACVALALWAVLAGRVAALGSSADYSIDARYDPTSRTLQGRESITWTNGTPVKSATACLHLYWNAFANNQSTFLRGRADGGEEWTSRHDDPWGAMTIERIAVGEMSLADSMRFLHPDDNNVDDRTVVEVRLPEPVAPGASVKLDIEFTARVPRVLARAGHAGPFVMMAQWFPKLGVFEGSRWNCHQYHSTTEFFSEFGRYDVRLTVPKNAVVGATGDLVSESPGDAETKVLTYSAESVHDFAWALDPRFVAFERAVGGTRLLLLAQPEHVEQRDRYLGAAETALRYYERWFGEYPYRQLTIIDPPHDARGAGGMEYPTLITVGTRGWMPAGLRLPETVTVHEVGHQYWYGLVATNEFEEAWLDEGVNSYVEGLIMDEAYGRASYIDLFGLRADRLLTHRAEFLVAPSYDPMVRMGWEFLDRQSYSAISYAKTALVLETLARLTSSDAVRTALADYARTWRFRHPTRQNFLSHLEKIGGGELQPWVSQLIEGSGSLDYAVTRVDSHSEKGFAGRQIGANGALGDVVSEGESVELRYESQVVVERLGEVRLPVDIDVRFEDGTTSHEHWDGQDRWRRFEYSGPQRVEWAVVDPSRVLVTDVNWLNNSRMRESGTRGVIRASTHAALWFQSLIHFLGGL